MPVHHDFPGQIDYIWEARAFRFWSILRVQGSGPDETENIVHWFVEAAATVGDAIELPDTKSPIFLNGPLLPQNPLQKVGGEAPHLFQWVLREARAQHFTTAGPEAPLHNLKYV
jgi:hypothetical protein